MRCDDCNSNVTGERVLCVGCAVAQAFAAIEKYRDGWEACPGSPDVQPHPVNCRLCFGFGAVPSRNAKATELLRSALLYFGITHPMHGAIKEHLDSLADREREKDAALRGEVKT